MLATVQFWSLPRTRAAALALLAALLTALAVSLGGRAAERTAPTAYAPPAREVTQPLPFVPNRGQTDPRVRYQAQAGDTGFFFTDRGATITLPGERDALVPPAFGADGYAVELRFLGAAVTPTATDRTSATVSYLGGARKQTALPTFDRLAYHGVWPGVDVSMAGRDGQLKYEFAVAAGADPAAIGLRYAGATGLAVAGDGSLRVDTPRGPLTDTAPVAWQTVAGQRIPVPVRYQLQGGTRYGFALGAHDPAKPLTIDPGIVYSTFLGGSGEDIGWAAAEDASGNAYITGETASATFPATAGAFDTTYNGDLDVFVTKLAPDGATLVYSTFFGAGGFERADGIAVDPTGAAYVTGRTDSAGATEDAFAGKLAADGASLAWVRFIGGSDSDEGEDIAIDADGNSYVTGQTFSGDFPTTEGAFDRTHNASGEGDLFVMKLAPGGGTLWSTYLGGESREGGGGIVGGIDVDSTGAPVVVNETDSDDYPTTAGALDTTGGGGTVTKVAPDGASLVYSTYLGPAGSGELASVRIGPGDAAYIVGDYNGDLPTTEGAYDRTRNGQDAFVAKLTSGGGLAYLTYLGGALTEQGAAIDVDGAGSAYVTGNTESADFPTTPDGFDTTLDTDPGFDDGFVTKLSADGSGLAYSSYLGGDSDSDTGLGLAVNADRFAVVTGYTFLGGDFPTTPGAFDTSYNDDPSAFDGEDAFAAKFDLSTEGPAGDPTCADGVDNDSDGSADLADSACQSPEGPAGDPSCANGVDDDGDGNVDLADTDCQSPEGPYSDSSCADGVDNDGDGLTDADDPDCIAPIEGPPGSATCSDGVDNDGDGLTDGADEGCVSTVEGPAGDSTCSDGFDNDGDGATDLADTDCQTAEGPVGDPSCTDGIDNDGDGGADLADSDCQQPEGPPGDPTCSDGIDNDNDGPFDQQDAGCQSPEGPAGDASCSDGIDNDGDGNFDALDDGCQTIPPGARCDGRLATVPGTTGTAGDDVIFGGPGPDVINGKGGNDRICGRGGDDTINGGTGDDKLYGQGNADTISGGMGADRIVGGVADDRLDGGRGNDKVIGNEDDDFLSGGPDTDVCDGRDGTDRANSTCEVTRAVP